MPTDAEQLALIKTQTLAVIVEITATPNPTYNIDGQNISWGDYLRQLQGTIAFVDTQLASLAPYEIHSQGFT
jgi:hypothetical protein